jgi:hypothetical protein
LCEKLFVKPNVLTSSAGSMRRIKPQTDPQPTPDAHGRPWQEVALLVGYLLICLLSILTVLLPTTENKEEQADRKAQGTEVEAADSAGQTSPPKPTK